MKKIFALLLVLAMLFSFAACNSKKEDQETTAVTEPSVTEPAANAELVSYVEKNRETLIAQFETGFTSSGMSCTSEIEVVGNGIVLTVCIAGMDNMTADQKELMQQTFDAQGASLNSFYEELCKETPALEYLDMVFCEEDGDVIASLKLPVAENSDSNSIANYMDLYGDSFIESLETGFASTSGMTCKSSYKIVGNGLVVDICINELEDLSEETKALMQETYDSMSDSFASYWSTIKANIPGLEYININVCEKDGDVIATLKLPTEGSSAGGTETPTDVASYMELYGDVLISTMESSIASSAGVSCTSNYQVVGNGLVINVCIDDWDYDIDEETKKLLQETYDSMGDQFDTSWQQIKASIPGIAYLDMNICQADGEVLATIRLGDSGTVGGETYYMISMTMDDETITAADLGEYADMFYLTLNSDGTGAFFSGSEAIAMEYDSSKIWPADAPEEAINYSISGNRITLTQDGDIMIFEK